jgi:recombinational DNA repair protein (RecF pathway)
VLPLVVAFQRGLLGEIGLAPGFEACVACGRAAPLPGRLHFSSFEGGLLCRDCEPARAEKYEVAPAAVDWLRGLAGSPAGLCPAFLTLDYHLAHLLGRRLPLARMLLTACDR